MLNGLKGLLLAALGYMLLSMSDVVLKTLGANYPITQITFFCFMFSFPLILFWLGTSEKQENNLRPVNIELIIIRIIGNIVSVNCAFIAIIKIDLTDAYGLFLTQPMFVTIFSIIILKEEVSLKRILPLSLGILGTVFILKPGINDFTSYHFFALISACTNAINVIIARKLSFKKEKTIVIMLYPFLATLVFSGIMMNFNYIPIRILDLWIMFGAGWLSVMSSILILSAYRLVFASKIAHLQFSQIIWSVVFGIIFFNEKPGILGIIGTLIIVLAGFITVVIETRENVGKTKFLTTTFSASIRPTIGPNLKQIAATDFSKMLEKTKYRRNPRIIILKKPVQEKEPYHHKQE